MLIKEFEKEHETVDEDLLTVIEPMSSNVVIEEQASQETPSSSRATSLHSLTHSPSIDSPNTRHSKRLNKSILET